MSRYHILAFVIAITALAGACAADGGTLVNIKSQAYFGFNNVRFAVFDSQGEIVWVDPAAADYGSFGVYAINNDPIDTDIAGTAAGKMRTNPEGPGWPYYTYGPHYTGPFLQNSLATASGVGPEYLGNWVGFRMGSDAWQVVGLRFDLECYYNPLEFRLEVWTTDTAGSSPQTLVAAFAPQPGQIAPYEFIFDGRDAVELRTVIGAVPEPSTCAAVISGIFTFGLALRRRTR